MPNFQIITGDCREIIASLDQPFAAVLTDPPYGCSNDCDYTRFRGGLDDDRRKWDQIKGDDEPFDPSQWLSYPKVCLFGFQFFAQRVPVGTVLVWNKKRPNQLGTFLSDAELGWMKGGKGCYLFNHVWHGFDRETERGKSLHPTQKPVALWRWVIEKMKLQAGQWVLDPFCGSGSCGVACIEMGLRYVGIEINPDYAATAERRLSEANEKAP